MSSRLVKSLSPTEVATTSTLFAGLDEKPQKLPKQAIIIAVMLNPIVAPFRQSREMPRDPKLLW